MAGGATLLLFPKHYERPEQWSSIVSTIDNHVNAKVASFSKCLPQRKDLLQEGAYSVYNLDLIPTVVTGIRLTTEETMTIGKSL